MSAEIHPDSGLGARSARTPGIVPVADARWEAVP